MTNKIKKTTKYNRTGKISVNMGITWVFVILSFLIPLFFYIKALCPTLSTYADAGEFPTVAYLNGFAHPPGYPLYTLILKGFIMLPLGDNPAQKANLASAVITATAVPVFYLLAKHLTNNTFASFTASLLMAFSPIYFRNAIVSEVFGLLVLFIALTFFLFIKWIETKNKNYFYGFLLTSGFGIAHHQLLIFTLIPLFIYFLFTKKWRLLKLKDYLLGILTVAIGFTPYLYIYFYASRHLAVMNWENPSTLQGLFRLLTRANYGTFILTNESRETDTFEQAIGIFNMFYQNFQLLGSFFIALGTLYLIYLKKWSLILYSYVVIIITLLFSTFSGMPVWVNGEIQYLERYILLSQVFTSILIAFGITFVLKVLSAPKLLYVISVITIIASVCLFINKNYKNNDQKDNYFADNLADDFYSSLPNNSILILEGDVHINNLFYNRFVLGKREDVDLILGGLLSVQREWYLKEIAKLYPDLAFPNTGINSADFLTGFIDMNSEKKPVFVYIPRLENDLSIDLPKVNHGVVWKYISGTQEPDAGSVQDEILRLLAGYKNLNIDRSKYSKTSPEYSQLNLYLQPYMYLARINDDDLGQSEKYYRKVLEIRPDDYQSRIELGDDYLMNGKEAKAVKYWREALLYIHDPAVKNEVQSRINEVENS